MDAIHSELVEISDDVTLAIKALWERVGLRTSNSCQLNDPSG